MRSHPIEPPTRETVDALASSHIADYPDWPEEGVLFRDITPLLRDARALRQVIEYWCTILPEDIEYIVGTEARGFVLGTPLAYELGAGFVPVRKVGKLPGQPRSLTYTLEYGTATVEIAENALPRGARVLVVDDLLATGGTAAATVALVRDFEVELLGATFLIELDGLGGREQIPDVPVTALWTMPA
ncbi:MAG: adenine phosphoribosyltransferase [Brachybacterium sp.]|nr:adenine phosphoribosyltransferase [Brachybacterium sp.]